MVFLTRAVRAFRRDSSIPSVVGCAPPSTRRAVRSASSSVVTASRRSSSVAPSALYAAGFTYTGEEASWHVVHPHPMSSYVADWADVVSTLRGTRFEKFLAMDGSSPQ